MDILKIIADNEALYKALHQLLLETISEPPNLSLNDMELGQRVRAQETARKGVETAMAQILRYKTRDQQDMPRNPAR